MKLIILGLLVFAQSSVFAIAADDIPFTKSAPIEQRMGMMGMVSKGFRLGVSKALLNGKLNSVKTSGDIRNDFGASLGYAYIPADDFGFLGHVYYSAYEQNAGAIRVDANLTYAFHDRIYALGGVNLNKFVKGDHGLVDATNKLGYQAGFGFQFHQMLGLDVQYTWIKNEYYNTDSLHMDGIEFVLHATF